MRCPRDGKLQRRSQQGGTNGLMGWPGLKATSGTLAGGGREVEFKKGGSEEYDRNGSPSMAVVGQFKLTTVFMRPKFHPPFLDWASSLWFLVRKNGAGRRPRDRCLPALELSLVMKRGVPGPAWFPFWNLLWKHQRLQDFSSD